MTFRSKNGRVNCTGLLLGIAVSACGASPSAPPSTPAGPVSPVVAASDVKPAAVPGPSMAKAIDPTAVANATGGLDRRFPLCSSA